MSNEQMKHFPARVCRRIIGQFARIRVPVTVTPQISHGPISTICCGSPILVPIQSACGSDQNQSCSFMITQNLRILIPIEFGADVVTDAPFVRCMRAGTVDAAMDDLNDEDRDLEDSEEDAEDDSEGNAEEEEEEEVYFAEDDMFTTEQVKSPEFENCIAGTRPLKKRGI